METMKEKTAETRKAQHLSHINEKEYGFFVRLIAERYEGGSRTVDNSYESFVCNTHNKKLCWCIGVEQIGINDFLKTWRAAYQYIECVYVPENALYTLDEINEKINSNNEPKSESEQIKEENENLKNELAELKKALHEAGLIKKNTKKQ